ncbi:unnamed protein product, partial [Ectocarpus sp. 12 AP-2014]
RRRRCERGRSLGNFSWRPRCRGELDRHPGASTVQITLHMLYQMLYRTGRSAKAVNLVHPSLSIPVVEPHTTAYRKHTVDETPRPKHWSQQQTARALDSVPSDLCGKGR